MDSTPLGRWYLNERLSSQCPLAAKALATLSPANPSNARFSKLKAMGLRRSISSP